MKKITVIGSVLSAMLMFSSCSSFRDMSDSLRRSDNREVAERRTSSTDDERFSRSMTEDYNYTRATDDSGGNTTNGTYTTGDAPIQGGDRSSGTVGTTQNARVSTESDRHTTTNRRNRNSRNSNETQRNSEGYTNTNNTWQDENNAYNSSRMSQNRQNGQSQYSGNDNSHYNNTSRQDGRRDGRQDNRYDDRNYSNYDRSDYNSQMNGQRYSNNDNVNNNGNNYNNREYADNYDNGFSSNQTMRPEVSSVNRNIRENAEYRRNNFQNNGPTTRNGNASYNNQNYRNGGNSQMSPGDPQVMYDYRYGTDGSGRYPNQNQITDARYSYRDNRSNANQMYRQDDYGNQSYMRDNYPNPYRNEDRNAYANTNRTDMDRLGDLVLYEIDNVENSMRDLAERAKTSTRKEREQMEKELKDLEKDRMDLYQAHMKIYREGRNDMVSVERDVRETLKRIRSGHSNK